MSTIKDLRETAIADERDTAGTELPKSIEASGMVAPVLTQHAQENAMADDKSKTKEDRKLVAANESYEVADFARKYGVPPSEAATIIKRYGPSRKKLDAHMAQRSV